MKNMEISLKPCPFCGGKARLKKHHKMQNTWYVQCHDCGIKTPLSIQLPYESWQDAKNYPVKLWNNRTQNALLQEIWEQIKNLPTISLNQNDCYKADVYKIINSYMEENQ